MLLTIYDSVFFSDISLRIFFWEPVCLPVFLNIIPETTLNTWNIQFFSIIVNKSHDKTNAKTEFACLFSSSESPAH